MFEFFLQDMAASLRDDSRRPFVLYWLVLVTALLDILAGTILWDKVYPYVKDLPSGLQVDRFLHIVLPVVFIVCMLKWPELGLLIALFYVAGRLSFHFQLLAVVIGKTVVKEGFEIPTHTIVWEVLAFSVPIAYLVGKDAIARAAERKDRHEVVDIGDRRFIFDKETGERLERGFVEVPLKGQERPKAPGTITVETGRTQVEIPWQYELRDGPDGCMFVATDTGTDESLIYYSVDEIPPLHRDTFARMLRAKDRLADRRPDQGVTRKTSSRRVKIPRGWEIEDGPEACTFIVDDAETGQSTVYQSLDEVPARHKEAFMRALKAAGRKRHE
ncbi:MAG: hypothetical protein ACYTEL_08480 [Planctomycetota bacterium]|jgi:hypothetical protein